MANLWGKEITRGELLRRVGDMHQIAGAQPFEFTDGRARGVRAVRLHNAVGLAFDVILDRGMGIGELAFGGIPLAYRTTNDFAHPAFAEPGGTGWLRTWPAGFLTTCGLTQAGSPCSDNGEARVARPGLQPAGRERPLGR